MSSDQSGVFEEMAQNQTVFILLHNEIIRVSAFSLFPWHINSWIEPESASNVAKPYSSTIVAKALSSTYASMNLPPLRNISPTVSTLGSIPKYSLSVVFRSNSSKTPTRATHPYDEGWQALRSDTTYCLQSQLVNLPKMKFAIASEYFCQMV